MLWRRTDEPNSNPNANRQSTDEPNEKRGESLRLCLECPAGCVSRWMQKSRMTIVTWHENCKHDLTPRIQWNSKCTSGLQGRRPAPHEDRKPVANRICPITHLGRVQQLQDDIQSLRYFHTDQVLERGGKSGHLTEVQTLVSAWRCSERTPQLNLKISIWRTCFFEIIADIGQPTDIPTTALHEQPRNACRMAACSSFPSSFFGIDSNLIRS